MSAGAASWLKVGSLRIPLLAEANSILKSRNGEDTAVVPTPEVDSSTWTPLVPPVGSTIQPLFVRLPASHAATDEVTSNLCQPVTTPGKAPGNPTPPTLVELHDEVANGRLVHVTVVCRKEGGDASARMGLSQGVPHEVVRGVRVFAGGEHTSFQGTRSSRSEALSPASVTE